MSLDRESYLLKSGLTRQLFNAFISDYQSYPEHTQNAEKPFVYVNEDGGVKVLTDLFDDQVDRFEEAFGVSVGEDGWMEMLEL